MPGLFDGRVRDLGISIGEHEYARESLGFEFEALVALQNGIVDFQRARAIIAYEKDRASAFVGSAVGDSRAA